jgi:hypothetical protein
MRSEVITHEVVPANAERWGIEGWLRRRRVPAEEAGAR